jgi:hypothetical protein
MARTVRNTRSAETGFGQPADPGLSPGFSERESGYTASSDAPIQTGLTRRQKALRNRLLRSVTGSAKHAFLADKTSVSDLIEVAADSLRRSSSIVEEMVSRSAETTRQFDLRSRRLDERLRENAEQLAALVADER